MAIKGTDVASLRPLVLALCAALAAGCGPVNERDDLDLRIATAAAEAGDGGRLDMGDVVPVDWDTMYAFGGYATDDQVREAVGADWPRGEDSRAPYDGRGLIVFVMGGQVAAWAVLNRGNDNPAAVRFDETGQAIRREDAQFVVDLRDRTVSGLDLLYLALER